MYLNHSYTGDCYDVFYNHYPLITNTTEIIFSKKIRSRTSKNHFLGPHMQSASKVKSIELPIKNVFKISDVYFFSRLCYDSEAFASDS